MLVRYLGHSSFYLLTAKGSSIIIDPYSNFINYDFPVLDADIVVLTHEHRDHNADWRVNGKPKVVKRTSDFQTEYEIPVEHTGEIIALKAIPSYHDEVHGRKRGPNSIFTFELDGIKFCHLGDSGHLLTEAQLQSIGKVDVLFVPVGGLSTINATEAALLINQINPRLVFPMHYLTDKIKGLGLAVETLDDFLKRMDNIDDLQTTAIKIDSAMLPEKTKIVVLTH